MSRPHVVDDPGAVLHVMIRHGLANASRWSGVHHQTIHAWANAEGIPNPPRPRAYLDELDPLCGCPWCEHRRLFTPAPPADAPAPDEWMGRALCRLYPPAVFFPTDTGGVERAKGICGWCPVRVPCLEYALANHEDHGVWGGTSERARRRIRAQRAQLNGTAITRPSWCRACGYRAAAGHAYNCPELAS